MNNRLLNRLTILFLVAFILIKVSPCYFQCQYLLSAGVSDHRLLHKMHTPARNTDLLVRADKSIDDKPDVSLLPFIKFAGVPFAVFFLGISLIIAKPTPFAIITLHSTAKEVCITQCILRL